MIRDGTRSDAGPPQASRAHGLVGHLHVCSVRGAVQRQLRADRLRVDTGQQNGVNRVDQVPVHGRLPLEVGVVECHPVGRA